MGWIVVPFQGRGFDEQPLDACWTKWLKMCGWRLTLGAAAVEMAYDCITQDDALCSRLQFNACE